MNKNTLSSNPSHFPDDLGDEKSLIRLKNLRKKLVFSVFSSAAGYQVPISVAYLAVALGFANSFTYLDVSYVQLCVFCVFICNFITIQCISNLNRRVIGIFLYAQVFIWCLLYVWFVSLLQELRYLGLFCSLVGFAIIFTRGGLKENVTAVCVLTCLHLSISYISIRWYNARGDFLLECLSSYTFFVVALYVVWVSSRLREQKQAIKQSKQKLKDTKKVLKVVKTEALTDHLTGLLNRRAISELIETYTISESKKLSNHVIVLVDIDHFKKINDHFGHAAGDQVLESIATCFKSILRKEDHIARWGGEEFLLILHGASLNNGVNICEKIRKHIELLNIVHNKELIKVTASFGLSVLDPNKIIDEQICVADDCLYEAKRNGRNCVKSPL